MGSNRVESTGHAATVHTNETSKWKANLEGIRLANVKRDGDA